MKSVIRKEVFMKFLKWLIINILINSIFIIPIVIFIDGISSLFLSITCGSISGIICLPLWFDFMNELENKNDNIKNSK